MAKLVKSAFKYMFFGILTATIAVVGLVVGCSDSNPAGKANNTGGDKMVFHYDQLLVKTSWIRVEETAVSMWSFEYAGSDMSWVGYGNPIIATAIATYTNGEDTQTYRWSTCRLLDVLYLEERSTYSYSRHEYTVFGNFLTIDGVTYTKVAGNNEITLSGTSWKLDLIVDNETGMHREPDYGVNRYVDGAYTLTFAYDGKVSGSSMLNIIQGDYIADYDAGTLFLDTYSTDMCCEQGDGELYLDVLSGGILTERPFKFKQYPQELRIYYNDDKEYFKFNKIEGGAKEECLGDSCREAEIWTPMDIPVEVMKILDNYISDSAAESGPLQAQKFGFLSEQVQISDLVVGKPIPEYMFKHTFLSAYPDTIPFYEIIEPADEWYVPILAHGMPQYELGLKKSRSGEWGIFMVSTLPRGGDDKWNLLSEFYPASTGINPIYFTFGKERYLYFPQLGSRKIYYLKYGFVEGDALTMVLSGAIDTLDDSRKLMEYWKAQGIDEVGRRFTDEEWCELTGRCEDEEWCEVTGICGGHK